MTALRSYRLLASWQARRLKWFIPLGIIIQSLFALGIVLGYPMLFPEIDQTTILYLATGAPTISLITLGLVLVPQLVSQAKTDGTLGYMRSLPVPRAAYLFADMSIWLVIVLPGVVFAAVSADLRFGLDLQPSPMVIPVMLLVALTATSIGYAIASLLPPYAAVLMTQVLVVFVLMFSPLNFPADRLPEWLAAIHRVLPIQAMGDALRGTIAGNSFPLHPETLVLLAAWCAASLGLTLRLLERRV
jgi:ABC-2 type transport system permease protein